MELLKSNGMQAGTPIDGWVIVISHGKQLIGRPDARDRALPLGAQGFWLDPAYAYLLMQRQLPDGTPVIVPTIEPFMRMMSITRLYVPGGIVSECDALDKDERAILVMAYMTLQEDLKVASAAAAGVTVATSMPRAKRP